jgi:hypothetical protein
LLEEGANLGVDLSLDAVLMKKTPAPTPAPTPFPDMAPHMPIAEGELNNWEAKIASAGVATERDILDSAQAFTDTKARAETNEAKVTHLQDRLMESRDRGLGDVDHLIGEIANSVRTKDAYIDEVKKVKRDLKRTDKNDQKVRTRSADAANFALQDELPPLQRDSVKFLKATKRDMQRESSMAHQQLDREIDDLKDSEADVAKRALSQFTDARRVIFRQSSRIRDTGTECRFSRSSRTGR